jgi:hypothetical protein
VHKLHLIPPRVRVLKRVHYYATLADDYLNGTFCSLPVFLFLFWLGNSRTHSAVHQAACVFCQSSSAYSSL